MGRDTAFAASMVDPLRNNASTTVAKANLLLTAFKAATGDTETRHVTSGWRPPALNSISPGAAPNSKHMAAQAIDIADPNGDFDEWCLENASVMEGIGLWQEHPSATKGWIHVQTVPPKSGKRVFYP